MKVMIVLTLPVQFKTSNHTTSQQTQSDPDPGTVLTSVERGKMRYQIIVLRAIKVKQIFARKFSQVWKI